MGHAGGNRDQTAQNGNHPTEKHRFIRLAGIPGQGAVYILFPQT